MENNSMKDLYKYFGKEKNKKDNQGMLSIENIFYEMGKENKDDEQRKDVSCSGRRCKGR